jgi:hypothetical protein
MGPVTGSMVEPSAGAVAATDPSPHVQAVLYRGSRGVVGEAYIQCDEGELIAVPYAVIELIGDRVKRFANIGELCEYIVEHKIKLTRLTVI